MLHMKLYNELLIEHYHHPRNYKRLDHPDYHATVVNPLCGDKLYLDVKTNNSVITEIGFKGEGCIISMSSASMLFDKMIQQKIDYLASISQKDVEDLIQLNLGPNRMKCALLPLEALKIIVDHYQAQGDLYVR